MQSEHIGLLYVIWTLVLKIIQNVLRKSTFSCPSWPHYEKLHPPKPHFLVIRTQKTICIQLLCNCPLDITTIMQLSP
jgi:hypothetical protein